MLFQVCMSINSLWRWPINVTAAFLFAVSFSSFAEECSTPLPSDVTRPQQQSIEGSSAFVGTWGNAKWDGYLCHTLVVEALAANNTATVVYSSGTYRPWNITAPSFYRLKGVISDTTLKLDFPSVKARAEYRIVDGKLHGKYFTQNVVSTIVMSRIQ